MKTSYKSLAMVLGFAGLVSYQSFAGAPQSNKAPLTPNQLQVYGDLIDSFSKTDFKSLSDRTFPLDLSALGKDAPCLQGIELEETKESSNAVHQLGPELLRGYSIHLVDPEQELAILKNRDVDAAKRGSDPTEETSEMIKDPGVLALSEIAFDKSGNFAVLKYVFLCGLRCNSGAILALEKVGSQWSGKTRRACTFAVNRDKPR
jgi:hypothetical protein